MITISATTATTSTTTLINKTTPTTTPTKPADKFETTTTTNTENQLADKIFTSPRPESPLTSVNTSNDDTEYTKSFKASSPGNFTPEMTPFEISYEENKPSVDL